MALMAAKIPLGVLALLLAGCTQPLPEHRLMVAAASDLAMAFPKVAAEFTRESGIQVDFSFAGTGILARQVQEIAPFDVFAAADTEHIDQLVASGHILAESRAVYARGQLAVWAPSGAANALQALSGPGIRFVAIAQPAHAPYGAAAVEALKSAGLWEKIQPKLVYAGNVNQAKQLAATGNADAALTAYSLVMHEPGAVFLADQTLYRPIEQALGILSASKRREEAWRFREFVLGPRGRAILEANGYQTNREGPPAP